MARGGFGSEPGSGRATGGKHTTRVEYFRRRRREHADSARRPRQPKGGRSRAGRRGAPVFRGGAVGRVLGAVHEELAVLLLEDGVEHLELALVRVAQAGHVDGLERTPPRISVGLHATVPDEVFVAAARARAPDAVEGPRRRGERAATNAPRDAALGDAERARGRAGRGKSQNEHRRVGLFPFTGGEKTATECEARRRTCEEMRRDTSSFARVRSCGVVKRARQ